MDSGRPNDLKDLIARIASRDAGSEAAMTQLYKALASNVLAFVRRRLSRADDATIEGVVIDCMYEVWRSAVRFEGNSEVRTWVLSIARHKLLETVRRLPPGVHEDIDDHAESLADENADVTTQLARRQRSEWLAYCMEKLPENQRESLHLLLVEGLAVEQIALIQGCPGGTVKTRVFHAKAKLKNCLAKWLREDMRA